MKRTEKQAIIAATARAVAGQLAKSSNDNRVVDIGTTNHAVTTTGEPGNVFGVVLARAGFGNGRKIKGGDCTYALKTVLGLKNDEALPTNVYDLLQAIETTTTENGPGKTYGRKTARLSKTLTELAEVLTTTQIGRPVGRPRTRATA